MVSNTTGSEPGVLTMAASKVLITGGAGFIGSHLADLFVERDCDVVVMDNLLTGDIRNIEHLIGNPRFQFIRHDVTEYIHVPGKIDSILHFASPASPIDYQEYPIQTLKVGSLGTHKALGLAKACGARFLLASTSEVYGDPLVHPQPETYWGNVNPNGIRSSYNEGKRCAESLCYHYSQIYDLDVRVMRIFNTYGPNMAINDGRVVSNFINQALNQKEITINGNVTFNKFGRLYGEKCPTTNSQSNSRPARSHPRPTPRSKSSPPPTPSASNAG